MKYFYIACQGITEEGKMWAFPMRVNTCQDLAWQLKLCGVEEAQLCETKKQCEELVGQWNVEFLKSGTHYLSPRG